MHYRVHSISVGGGCENEGKLTCYIVLKINTVPFVQPVR